VNGYYALANNVQPIVSKQTAYDIGQNWLNSPQIFSAHQPVSLCWSPELGLFCSGCASNVIVNSRDGLTWNTIGISGGYGNSNDICWSPELRIFVVIAYNNHRCATSPDGFTWTTRTGLATLSGLDGHNIQWGSVCWSRELGLFCVVGNDDGASFKPKSEAINNYCVALSSDGINWNLSTSGVKNYYWAYVCWSAELGLFCAVSFGSASSNRIMVSRDGYNWSNATNGNGSYNYIQVCWSPELGLFCAVGDNGIVLSRDGYNWSPSISGVRNTRWEGVCWSAELGLFCAVSPAASTGNNEVIISRDGYHWTEATSGVAPIGWGNICWSPELSIFCSLSYSGTNTRRAMITNPIYRLPTTKSIQTLTNDGYYNINIASTPSGTFPNFRTTATGPNLINIGNGNYRLVAGALRDSIAIGNTILNASNPNGYGMIGVGQNIFPTLTSGFQNIGIGNAIATSMATGHNNVFIGNGVATSITSTGNTVAIGTNAGRTNTTGINNTYLGAFTGASLGTYSNSTAIGFGATINASNEIVLGTLTEHVRTPGNPYWYSGLSQTNKLTFVANVRIAIAPAASTFQNSFSNRITIFNTYFLVVPEFAFGIYRAQLSLNLNTSTRSDAYDFNIYQYAIANAITSNIISSGTTPKAPDNFFVTQTFEFAVPTYTNDSSIDHSCLFQYAPGTTNRAFLFTWRQIAGSGDLDYANGSANIWSWITLYKIA
jgi:hypothetical protein